MRSPCPYLKTVGNCRKLNFNFHSIHCYLFIDNEIDNTKTVHHIFSMNFLFTGMQIAINNAVYVFYGVVTFP